mgnify:CR=1 FL=1
MLACFAAQIELGVDDDRADVAHQYARTRGRRRQLINPRLLARDIQKVIVALEVLAGRQPLSDRAVHHLTESLLWTDQRALRAGR